MVRVVVSEIDEDEHPKKVNTTKEDKGENIRMQNKRNILNTKDSIYGGIARTSNLESDSNKNQSTPIKTVDEKRSQFGSTFSSMSDEDKHLK